MIKKKIPAIIFALILVLSLALPVFADDDDEEARLNYVTDAAGILTETEISGLETAAAQITAEHGCSIYIVSVDDYTLYTDYDEGVMDCATDIYDDYDLGYGDDEDGILLLLSMEDRDYAIVAHGDKANGAFTDYGKYVLADEFLDNFSEDDWYGGFSDYLTSSNDFLVLYEGGTPVDTNPEEYDGRYDEQYEKYFGRDYSSGFEAIIEIFMVLVLPILIAVFVIHIFKRRMKSVFTASSANRYVDENSLVIDDEWDKFSHVTEIIIPKPDTKGSSSYGGGLGGGGTTIGSGGFSGHGGKF